MKYLVTENSELPALIEAESWEQACEIATAERMMKGPFTEGATTIPDESIAACCAAVLSLGEVIVPPGTMRAAVEADEAAIESLLCQPPRDGVVPASEVTVILDAFATEVLDINGWPDELSEPDELIDAIAAAVAEGKITRA